MLRSPRVRARWSWSRRDDLLPWLARHAARCAGRERQEGGEDDDADRQRHARPHRVDEAVGEDRMSELRELVGDLLRDARGQLERGPVLARADLEALLSRVREAGDERLLERRGKLARVRDGLRAERR